MGVKSRIRNIDKELKGWMNVMAGAIRETFEGMDKRIAKIEKQLKKIDEQEKREVVA